MSCYFRHLKEILEQAGIEVTPANKKQVDQAIHNIAEVTYKDCPATWKKLKHDILSDEQKKKQFIEDLKVALK
jgi:hypothetical protein